MNKPNSRVPILLPLLTLEKIEQIRKCFHYYQTFDQVQFVTIINKFLPPDKPLSEKTALRLFAEIDWKNDEEIDATKFFDFLLYECQLCRGVEKIKFGFLFHSYWTGTLPCPMANLDVSHIEVKPNKLRDIGCIRKIYPYSTSRLDPSIPEDQKRGLYVTVIGKRAIGFWRPEVTMITHALCYVSQKVPDYSVLPKLGMKRTPLDTLAGREALRVVRKYSPFCPEFDLMCMDDFELIATYQILARTLFFYDAKTMELKCSISQMPLEITCSHYLPRSCGFSKMVLGGANGILFIIELSSDVEIFQAKHTKHYTFETLKGLSQESYHVKLHHFCCHKNGYLTKVQFCNYRPVNQLYIISSAIFDSTKPKSCTTLALIKLTLSKEPPLIQSIFPPLYFPVKESVHTFCFDEEDGFLFSGGWDGYLRVFSVTDLNMKDGCLRCHNVHRGNQGLIIGVHFYHAYCQVIYMTMLGYISVWDFLQDNVVQTYNCAPLMSCLNKYLNSHEPKGPFVPPAFYFCKKTESVFIGDESIIIIPYGDLTKETLLTSTLGCF